MFKNIWDSHSALSEESDIYSLTFVRWNRREEFSPWNCILLSLQEATAHLKLEDAEGVNKYLVKRKEVFILMSYFLQ